MNVQKTVTTTGVFVISISLLTGIANATAPVTTAPVARLETPVAVTQTVDKAVSNLSDSEVFELAGVSAKSTTAVNGQFKDVPQSHWAYSAIQQAVKKGYFKGYSDGTFKPNSPVSREEFAVLLDRVSSNPSVDEPVVLPGTSGRWSESGIQGAVSKGFINPSSYPVFNPTNSLTRYEMMRWMAGGLEVANKDFSEVLGNLKNTVIPVREFYQGTMPKGEYSTVALGIGTGLMTGFADGQYGGAQATTRAEVAAILLRYENVQKKKPSDFKNLVTLNQLGRDGTNAEQMGYSWDNNTTFKETVQGQTITLKGGWGTVRVNHMIIVDPRDKDALFYPVFFGPGNSLDALSSKNKYFIFNHVTAVTAKDKFNIMHVEHTYSDSSIGSGAFATGTEKKYGAPLLPNDPLGNKNIWPAGVTKTFYASMSIGTPEYVKDGISVGMTGIDYSTPAGWTRAVVR